MLLSPFPSAKANASSWIDSLGEHNSPRVPRIPLISPLCLNLDKAAIVIAEPGLFALAS